MILATQTDWVGLLTALGVFVPIFVGGILKVIAAIDSAHTTASKAAAAAQVAADTAAEAAAVTAEIHKNIQLPSNGTTIGAAMEGVAQVQHMSVNLQKPPGSPDIPSAISVARELAPNVAVERRENIPVPPLPPMRDTIPTHPTTPETPPND